MGEGWRAAAGGGEEGLWGIRGGMVGRAGVCDGDSGATERRGSGKGMDEA